MAQVNPIVSQFSRPYDSSASAKTHVVPAKHGYAFEVKKGDVFRIVDLHGKQVVDFMGWVQGSNLKERLNMAYTRYHLSGVCPAVGETLMTNKLEPIFKVLDDTVKTHDMTFMCCHPEMYEKLGAEKGHRSCATNIAEVMKPYGMGSYLEVGDPFNVFQNTPLYTLKPLNCSRAGDYFELEALKDAVCAVSACPFEIVSLLR